MSAPNNDTVRAPERCVYCDNDPDCGFCENGNPLDTQADWDRTWGRVLRAPEAHRRRP